MSPLHTMIAISVSALFLAPVAGSQVSTDDPIAYPDSSPELLALGKSTYERKCLPCHGQ